MGGFLDQTRLSCSICKVPYRISQITLERLYTGIFSVDVMLNNTIGISIMMNYLCVLYGIHTGQEIAERLMMAQLYIYLLYANLYAFYVKIENLALYTDIALNGNMPIYMFIQAYSFYAALTDKFILMSITGLLGHHLLWKEHMQTLRLVNENLLKND
jgi:hypothetical protein